MSTAWLLTPLLLACAGRPAAVSGPQPDRVGLGLSLQELDEGLLVTAVSPGGPAEAAGLVAGDLLVAVDGVEVRKAPTAVRHALQADAGAPMELVLRGPLGGDYREIQLQAGPTGPPPSARLDLPAPVAALRLALLRQGPRAATRRAQEAVQADFGGMTPGDALSFTLRRALERRPAVARAVAEVLTPVHPEDDALRLKLGEAWHGLGEHDRAAVELAAAQAQRPPDVWDPAGDWRGDAGGNARGRSMLADSLLELGDRQGATDLARALLASLDDPALRGALGLAPIRQEQPWRASLPSIQALDLITIDGQPWRMSDHQGRPVVITFFATWCTPCRQELPELHAMWAERRDQGLSVLAISVDEDPQAADLQGWVRGLGLPFPVVHAPELRERFGVSGIPALRLVDGRGALVYSARGWSPSAIPRLARVVDEVLALDAGAPSTSAPSASAASPGEGPPAPGESLLGYAWSVGPAELVGFLGVPGARAVVAAADAGAIALGRDEGPPVVLGAEGAVASLRQEGPAGGALLAWLDGPVVAAPGERWLRALSPGGRPRWLSTTPGPVAAMAGGPAGLWVATEDELLLLDSLGRLALRVPGGATDLAADDQGGAWAVDGATLRHLGADGQLLADLPARGAVRVDGTGRVASEPFEDLLTARLGPGGAARSVLVRTDGVVVGLDGQGAPAFTWRLPHPARLAAVDADADGQDELLVAVRGQGLATLSLLLP